MRWPTFSAAIFLAAICYSAQARTTLISIDSVTGRLHEVDPATATLAPLAAVDEAGVLAIANDPRQGTLYGVSTRTDNLVEIDPRTGNTTVIGNLGVHIIEIEFDSSQDSLFGLELDLSDGIVHLYEIDVATGAASVIGPTGLDFVAGGMAFDASGGVMYATDAGLFNSESLYTIDLGTGVTTLVGEFGLEYGATWMTGLAFDPILGLYGVDNGGGLDDKLYKIDPSSGEAMLIGALGDGDGNFVSATFVNIVPEPTAFALVVAAMGFVTIIRRSA